MQKTIMLIEDNADDEALTLRTLQKQNIANDIVVAHDGAEAIELLLGENAAGTPLPELVLLDLKLPKVSGLEVLKQIRANERTRTLPVVVLTSSDEEKDLTGSYDYGANSYVRKPVDFLEFAEAVKQLGVYWLVLNEPPPRGRESQ